MEAGDSRVVFLLRKWIVPCEYLSAEFYLYLLEVQVHAHVLGEAQTCSKILHVADYD